MTLTGAPGAPGWTMLTGCADAGAVRNRQAAMAVPAVSIGARLVISVPFDDFGGRLAASRAMGKRRSRSRSSGEGIAHEDRVVALGARC